MEHYFILARSVTIAQRMMRTLEQSGIFSRIFRAPRDLTGLGCAYLVRVKPGDLRDALAVLHTRNLNPVQIFVYRDGFYQEVEPS